MHHAISNYYDIISSLCFSLHSKKRNLLSWEMVNKLPLLAGSFFFKGFVVRFPEIVASIITDKIAV